MTINARFDNLPTGSVICPWIGKSYHGAHLGAFYDRNGDCWMAEGRQERAVVVFDEWYQSEQDMDEWSQNGRLPKYVSRPLILAMSVGAWLMIGAFLKIFVIGG